jgi:copper oxidase (laccase) domain-containing protein
LVKDFERAFEAAGGLPPGGLERGEGDRFLVDLEALLLGQLDVGGVPASALDLGAPCTHATPDFFFSYRRDGPGRGLLGHVIVLPGEVAL